MEQVGNVCTLVCIYHVQANARKKLEKGLWVVRVQEPQSKRDIIFCYKEFQP